MMRCNGSHPAVRFFSQGYSVVAFWQYAASGFAPKLHSTNLSVRFFPFRELTPIQPGVDHRVRVKGYAAKFLAADADVFAPGAAGLDGHAEDLLHRRIALVEAGGHQAGVAVQAQGELGHVVGADGEPVEVLQKLLGQQAVGWDLAHHDQAQAVLAPPQAVGRQGLGAAYTMRVAFWPTRRHRMESLLQVVKHFLTDSVSKICARALLCAPSTRAYRAWTVSKENEGLFNIFSVLLVFRHKNGKVIK